MSTPNDLYIIGYGFCDQHINTVIEDSCKKGTRLIVLDVLDFNDWTDKVASKKLNGFSMAWISRYYNSSFSDLFPASHRELTFKFDGSRQRSRETLKDFTYLIDA